MMTSLPADAVTASDAVDTAGCLMRTTHIATPLGGWMFLAATAQGIAALTLGDDPDRLQDDLYRRFPAATCIRADASLTAWAQQITTALQQTHTGAAAAQLDLLPLDLHGTPFQRRVWAALRQIPAGETTPYAALAARIGAPGSVRAVATACGANPVAVLVPCHRVIRSDGTLSGYRWGVARKRKLLAWEGQKVGLC